MKNSLIIITGLLCSLFVSCSTTEEDTHGNNSGGQVNVTFSVTLPSPETVNTYTRATTGFSDTDIKTVDVLVFDKDGKFMNRIKVDEPGLIATESGVNFSVRLDATSDKRIIHLVANGRTSDGMQDRINFVDITPSMAESAAVPSLHTVMPDEGSELLTDVMPLVMWGRTELNGISVVSKAEGVKLLRSAACVQVRKGVAEAGNGLNDLTINQISVVGAPTQGYLTPAAYSGTVSTPTVARPMPGVISWEAGKTKSGSDAMLYVYERNSTTEDYLGVIISALYKGEPCYYKVVVASDGQAPMNVIRNHRYILTVVKVNGPGYADMNTAIASAPSNTLKTELTDDSEDFPCIVADGQYLMALTNNCLDLYGLPSGEVELGIVYVTRGVQPRLSVPADCSWLTNLNAVSLGGNKYKITGTFSSIGVSSASTTLTLVCDNLSQTLQVTCFPGISDNKDDDSYVVDLPDAVNKNWSVKVVTEGKALYLHPSASSPSAFSPLYGPGEGMVKELTSKYASHAYLHIAVGGSGEAKVATSVNGVVIARKIVVMQ